MPERVVHHPKYGRGVVKGLRHKGFELYVEFESGLARWVRLNEVAEDTDPLPTPARPSFIPIPVPNESFKSRRMIEAFRLGIVPYDCAENFTFGRKNETDELVDWLYSTDDTESTLLLVGEYGTGKTHLLHYIYGRALQEGFAVASVEMDANEVPFHKPKRVYSRVVQTLRYRAKDGQLRSFRDLLKGALHQDAFKDHQYFSHLIGKTSDETLWDWIEGRESAIRPWSFDGSYSSLPGLYDYSTAANIYCYLLSSLGWATKEIFGLKGLVLIFDEAEAVDTYNTLGQKEKGRNYLTALIRTANNEYKLLNKPNYLVELEYCYQGVGRDLPFLYRQPSGLKLLFAFTPTAALNRIPEFQSAERIDLQPLTDAAFKEVFEHICLLYENAYNFQFDDSAIKNSFRDPTSQSGRTRRFVKASVETLDILRLNHGKI